MIEQLEDQFTKYEIARILGARALQIAMDAPLLLKLSEKELEEINYNPIEIAKKELISGVLPITVNRPLPKRKEEKIKKMTKEEIEEIKQKEEAAKLRKKEEAKARLKAGRDKKKSTETEDKTKEQKEVEADKKVEETEETEEKEIAEDGEIMELAAPEDEAEETSESVEEGI